MRRFFPTPLALSTFRKPTDCLQDRLHCYRHDSPTGSPANFSLTVFLTSEAWHPVPDARIAKGRAARPPAYPAALGGTSGVWTLQPGLPGRVRCGSGFGPGVCQGERVRPRGQEVSKPLARHQPGSPRHPRYKAMPESSQQLGRGGVVPPPGT